MMFQRELFRFRQSCCKESNQAWCADVSSIPEQKRNRARIGLQQNMLS